MHRQLLQEGKVSTRMRPVQMRSLQTLITFTESFQMILEEASPA
jgi:hypothetical protein